MCRSTLMAPVDPISRSAARATFGRTPTARITMSAGSLPLSVVTPLTVPPDLFAVPARRDAARSGCSAFGGSAYDRLNTYPPKADVTNFH